MYKKDDVLLLVLTTPLLLRLCILGHHGAIDIGFTIIIIIIIKTDTKTKTQTVSRNVVVVVIVVVVAVSVSVIQLYTVQLYSFSLSWRIARKTTRSSSSLSEIWLHLQRSVLNSLR